MCPFLHTAHDSLILQVPGFHVCFGVCPKQATRNLCAHRSAEQNMLLHHKKLSVRSEEFDERYDREHCIMNIHFLVTTPYKGQTEPHIRLWFDSTTRISTGWIDIIVISDSSHTHERLKGNLSLFYENEVISFAQERKFMSSEIRASKKYAILIYLKKLDRGRKTKMFNISIKTHFRHSISIPTYLRNVGSVSGTKFVFQFLIQSHLRWESGTMLLSQNNLFKVVALPGEIKSMHFNSVDNFKSTVVVYWIHDLYKNLHFKSESVSCSSLISGTSYNYCVRSQSLSYDLGPVRTYMFFWGINRYHGGPLWSREPKHIIGKGKTKKTWKQASELCRSLGGYLPIIRSKYELDELTSIFKLSEGMPYIEAIYIGLLGNSAKVSASEARKKLKYPRQCKNLNL